MIKAVIFDFDGVIVDSEWLHKDCEREVLAEYGIRITPEEQRECVGRTAAEIFSILKRNHRIPRNSEELMKKKAVMYLERARARLKMYNKAADVLRELKSRYKLALTTSSRRSTVEFLLSHFSLNEFFDVVVTGDDVQRGKPHPEPFLRTMEKLGLKPEECVVIEDAVNGIKAAKSSGAYCIGVATTFREEELREADMIIRSIENLGIEMIESLDFRK